MHPLRLWFLPLLPALLLIASCDDGAGPVEEEALARGFRIVAEGTVLASASGATALGTLQAPAGSESPLLEVEFLDQAGRAVTPAPGLTLDARVHLPEVATLQVVSASELTARLRGVAPGTTTARFTLLRNGRAQYISPPVEVAVGDPGS